MTTCCPTQAQAVASDYTRKSTDFYITGRGNRKALIMTPDIFGGHPNAYQLCDILASHGFLVVMPDYFRGTRPPESRDQIRAWIGGFSYAGVIKPIIEEAVAILKALGATSIGMLGLCWGGKMAVQANADRLVSCIASPHPSFVDENDAKAATGPWLLMPTKTDPPMLEAKAVMETNQWKAQNVFIRFDDQIHGFLGARGDWSDATVAARTNEAIGLIVKFFNANLV